MSTTRRSKPDRFRAQKRVTDSGRSRHWFVKDALGVFPIWKFGDGSAVENEALAQAAAAMLNLANRLNLAYTEES